MVKATEKLKEEIIGLSQNEQKELAVFCRALVEERLSSALHVQKLAEIEEKNGAQSRAFLIEMLPDIWGALEENRRYSRFSWLDVGPGAGYAAGLLSSLHRGITLGYQLDVSVIDINDIYRDLIQHEFPYIKSFHREDIFDHQLIYDYVSCSHVIEHVPEPVEFVKRLQSMASNRVFVLTPWKEREDILTKGHVNIFDEDFVRKVSEFTDLEVKYIPSVAWGAFLQPRYEMLFMKLPGKAKLEREDS